MKKVIIASNNPVKIKAAKKAFERMFPEEVFEFNGVSVPSDVSDQPITDEETYKGAYNRATKAASNYTDADFTVGIEGGTEDTKHGMEAFAWIVIRSKNGVYGKGRSGTFLLPEQIAKGIREGEEMGDVCDEVFNTKNHKQKSGTVGILTNDIITRTSYYVDPCIFALIPFMNNNLYEID